MSDVPAGPDGGLPPALTLEAFAHSLYHGARADNYFKFLHNLPEAAVADFLQGLLHQVARAVDSGDTVALRTFVQQAQVQGYAGAQPASAVRPDLPPLPLAPLRRPLPEATVALLTSGGVYRDDQPPFYPAHLSYAEAMRDTASARERVALLRVIPGDTPDDRLRVGHIAYDLGAAQEDPDVIFPLARMRELAAAGEIGALAARNYSYHGLTNIPRLRDETAAEWATMLLADGVDAVVLTPG